MVMAPSPARLAMLERQGVLGRKPARLREMRHEPERRPTRVPLDGRMPSAKSEGSPRKRLTMKPTIFAASAASITALVPTICAITPPRSMSPTSATGTSAACAKPILAMSPWRRLISEALPAPSTRTRSDFAFSRSKLSSTAASRRGFKRLIFARLGVRQDAALHHDLRARLALRLQQHGVHVDAGRNAASSRLQGLGAPDLAAIFRDGGVVRHVLRLERQNREPAPREGAREACDDQRFADIRPGALDHQGLRRHQGLPLYGVMDPRRAENSE